jgi:hypothetical protein
VNKKWICGMEKAYKIDTYIKEKYGQRHVKEDKKR